MRLLANHRSGARRGAFYVTWLLRALLVAACARAPSAQVPEPGTQTRGGVKAANPLARAAESGNLYRVVQSGRVGFIDGAGRVVIRPQFATAYPFSEGFATVVIGGPEHYKYAFIDTAGRVVFETEDSPGEKGFSSGVAVLLKHNSSSNYYVDKNFKWVAGFYDHAEDCTEGLCAVRFDPLGPRHWGYISTSGAVVVKGQYDWARPFSEGVARVGVMTGEPHPEHGAPAVEGREGYIDHSGKMVTPLRFEEAWDFSEGMAQVRVGGKWGYIEKSGRVVIAPQFEDSQPFKGGLARVKSGGRWGYVNKSGETVIAPQFLEARDFSEGWAAVTRGGGWLYIDGAGKTMLQVPYRWVGPFRNGVALFRDDDKSGVMDRAGRVLVAPQYQYLEMVSDELILVEDEEKGIGYIDYTGREVWKPRR